MDENASHPDRGSSCVSLPLLVIIASFLGPLSGRSNPVEA